MGEHWNKPDTPGALKPLDPWNKPTFDASVKRFQKAISCITYQNLRLKRLKVPT
jgi:hypothetical protein